MIGTKTFCVGDRVRLAGTSLCGTVKQVNVVYNRGTMVMVELDSGRFVYVSGQELVEA